MKDTLLLNADHSPLQVLDWRRAIWLVMTDRVYRIHDYGGLLIRSEALRLPWPAVVCLSHHATVDSSGIALSRASILARDHFTCQYCGWTGRTRTGRPFTQPLTVDHVVPRAQSHDGQVVLADGRAVPLHSWENTVAACRTCNHAKGARTPAQADMPLKTPPRRPGPTDAVRITFAKVEVEVEWVPYLPAGTGVRGSSQSAA